MKTKNLWFAIILLVATLLIGAGSVLASPYGSGAYGECLYEGDGRSCAIITPSGDKGTAADGEEETAEPAEEETGESEPAPTEDDFEQTIPSTIATTKPSDGLPLASIVGALAALIGAGILLIWAAKRRRREEPVYEPMAVTAPPPVEQAPAPEPTPTPKAPVAPLFEPGQKTDVNLAPDRDITAAQTQTPASEPAPTLPSETETASAAQPQAGETVAPKAAAEPQNPAAEASAQPTEPASQSTAGISHRDIHGPSNPQS